MFSDESASMREMDYQNGSEYADQSALEPIFTHEQRRVIFQRIGYVLRQELGLEFRLLDAPIVPVKGNPNESEPLRIGDLILAADNIKSLALVGTGRSNGDIKELLNLCRAELERRLPELRDALNFYDTCNRWKRGYRSPVQPIGEWDLIQAKADVRAEHKVIDALDKFFKAIGRVPDRLSDMEVGF